jgi:hypothetical protein
MKTVVLIEGFAGGPMHTREFREALSKAGFKVIKDRRKANIIIAHSAGMYAIPMSTEARLLMLIGPNYWPGKFLLKRTAKHNMASSSYHFNRFGFKFLLRKKLLEFYYFFRRHSYLWHGVLNTNRLDRLHNLIEQPGRMTIVIRNSHDPFTTPEIKQEFKSRKVKFIELPGVHDDYYMNPKPYVDLLLKEL